MANTKRTGKAIEPPQAIHDCHALLLWIIPQLDKFPRLRRYTLGERIETLLLQVLERLLEAAYSSGRDKTRALQRASQQLNVVRHLWRLSHELKAVPPRALTSQIFANLYLNDIDHWLTGEPACGAYLRYVDDLYLLGDSKAGLWRLRGYG